MALRSLSLCSGVGGLDLALSPWCRTVGYVEREVFAQEVLLARMEDARLDRAPVWPDLERFPARALRGAVDIVAAGFPCPPFSSAGDRKGRDDERYLWPLVRAALARTRAPLAFLENVGGAVRHPDGLGRWLSDLARLGFDAEWTVVQACDIGSPQERARIFVLAYAHERGRERLRLAQHADEQGARGRVAHGRGAHGPLEGAPVGDAERAHLERPGEPGELPGSARAREAQGAQRERHGDAACDAGEAVVNVVRSGSGGPDPVEARAGDGQRPAARRWAEPSEASFPPGPEDAAGWRSWIDAGGPQPVLRRGLDGAFAWLDRSDRLRALGNGVVPAQARAAFELLARRILE